MIDLPKPEVYQDTDTNFTKFWNIRNVLYNVVQILIVDRGSGKKQAIKEMNEKYGKKINTLREGR